MRRISTSRIIVSLIVVASLAAIHKNRNLLSLVNDQTTSTPAASNSYSYSSPILPLEHRHLEEAPLAVGSLRSTSLSFVDEQGYNGSLPFEGNLTQREQPHQERQLATPPTSTATATQEHAQSNMTSDSQNTRMHVLRNLHGKLSKVHDEKREEGLVVYSIFAGRREPLSIQLPYILTLLEKEVIDEVHIWNYTCRAMKFNHQDSLFLQEELLPSIPNSSFLINPPPDCEWTHFYEFYARFLTNGQDVLLKVDDDIVFVDTTRVASFVKEIRSFPQVFLWSANVINNGKAAAFQTMDGLLTGNAKVSMLEEAGRRGRSLGKLYNNRTLGLAIHRAFIANPTKFFHPTPRSVVRRVKGRLSINFIGLLGPHLEQASRLVSNHVRDDEHALSTTATFAKPPAIVLIYTPLIVSHGSFRNQDMLRVTVPLYSNVSIANPYHTTPPPPVLRIPDGSEANKIPQ